MNTDLQTFKGMLRKADVDWNVYQYDDAFEVAIYGAGGASAHFQFSLEGAFQGVDLL